MKYGNRSPWKRIVYSRLTLIALFIVSILLTKATWNIHQKSEISEMRLDKTQASLLKLETRKNDLAQKVEYLSTEDGIKSEIRNKFRAAEDGEYVAVIIESHQFATTTATSSEQKQKLWSRILTLFGL